ncbi:MAG: SRPBCC family protein [Undibacterium sp.]|nr:SRPBCC family protein [Undibacterium sp.]
MSQEDSSENTKSPASDPSTPIAIEYKEQPVITDQTEPTHSVLLKALAYVIWCGCVVSLGAFYGITAYTFFSTFMSGTQGVMLTSFLVGVPMAMGVMVAYFSRKKKANNILLASALSMISLSLFVFAAGALFREGSICIVMALGLFVPFILLGAVIAGIVSLFKPNQSAKMFSISLLMPFALGSIENNMETATIRQQTLRSVYIEATPDKVWTLINFPLAIRPEELQQGFAYKIGVPYPIEARTLQAHIGGKRQLLWQRGVHFEEEITDWQEQRRIAWKYLFTPTSFPDGSLDDHVVIGGQYFNLEDTAYTLQPEGSGTRLSVQVGTRVSTHFNWYAGFWAKYLVADTAETILDFYKQRAQTAQIVAVRNQH